MTKINDPKTGKTTVKGATAPDKDVAPKKTKKTAEK